MSAMPRLAKRGDIYYFRTAVPKHLVGRFGRAELTVSLRTSLRSIARIRCHRISSAIEILFDRLPAMPELTVEDVNQRVRAYFQRCLNAGEEYVQELPADPRVDVEAEILGLQQSIEMLRSELLLGKFGSSIVSDANELVHPTTSNGGSDDLEAAQYAYRAVARAQIEQRRILAAKLAGDYDSINPQDPLFAGMMANGFPPLPGQEQASTEAKLTISEAVERYLDQKKAAWAPKTIQAVGHALRLASELFGPSRLLAAYGTEDKKRLRDMLAALPPNHNKLPAFKGMTATEAAAANKEGPRLSPKSQEKTLEFVGSLFHWALHEGYIEKIPGPGVKVLKVKKYVPGPAREPYR